ncbi:patatin-like protein 2 [Arachis stenosperma]|uniref:patatin-like protein 2 n=1 Tax=Arachis stenosperma TaxID=217475 RepID=UPI0025AB7910|nr:patatin-like protein 2 [Arachis stenosperma]
MAGLNSSRKLPPPSVGKLLTVLSIDGGGIKGLIPAVVLHFLEGELKKLDGEQARIADYFDVIAGTSTGGLIAAMLGAPDDNANNPRPKYNTDDIKNFYKNDGPIIFTPPEKPHDYTTPGPIYDGTALHDIVNEGLGSTRLVQAWTNLVIPTFDILRLRPVIFSKFKAQEDEFKYLNGLLSDISISTSAAPVYLPAHCFTSEDGNTEFNMIDGGAAAGSPVLVALSELGQEKMKHPELYPMMDRADDCSNILLLSLGCGVQPPAAAPGWIVDAINQWNQIAWMADIDFSTNPPTLKRLPALEITGAATTDVVEYYAYSLFKAHHAERNYLRVQTDALTPDMDKMDNADPDNLKNLEDIAKKMIDENVKKINPVTFQLEPIDNTTTYQQELIRYAKLLSEERKGRIAKLGSKKY